MRYEEFIDTVGELAGVPPDEATHATRAVLLTLSEQLGPKEFADMASQLPKGLKDAFKPGPVAEPFNAAEFVRRVAHRTGTDISGALKRARAVFLTLREAVSPGELEDWQLGLPVDYVYLAARPVVTGSQPRTGPRGPRARVEAAIGARDFIRRVAQRAGLDEEQARRATEAVLETFGERIAGGEAEDLAALLPEPLATPLLRPGGDPEPIPLADFLSRVARREGELPGIAREHARAVLATLREAVSVEEWRDTEAELPREYRALLA
jgi:uncharacterized protein (DUF2267 family)